MFFSSDLVFNTVCQLTLIQFTLTWVISFLIKNVAIIDFLWGTTYAVNCAMSFYINFFNLNSNDSSRNSLIATGKSDDTVVITTAKELNDKMGPNISSIPYFSNLFIALFALTAVSFHGLRLSIHLGRRVLQTGEDKRYADIRKKIGEPHFWWLSFFMIFLGQWFISLIICAPFRSIITSIFNIKQRSDVNYSMFFFGLLFANFGTWYETIADAQMTNFLKANNCFVKKRDESLMDKSNNQAGISESKEGTSKKGKESKEGTDKEEKTESSDNQKPSPSKLYTKGLWRFSRHPNYFGECMFHWGMYIVSFSLGNYFAFYPALMMTCFHRFVSGVPLTEKYMMNNEYYGEQYKNEYMKEVKNAMLPDINKILSFNKEDVKVE